MNWMDMNKTAEFWKAWQEGFKPATGESGADAFTALWKQQEQLWKSAMEQGGKYFGQQPDMTRQWQDLQAGFLKQWSQMAEAAMDRSRMAGIPDPSGYMKRFAEETEKWFAGAFRDRLPEQLRPHFQTYFDLYRMFHQQWENLEAMVRNGMVDPKHVWQWVDPRQYGESMGRIMGFKPMKDLDEAVRQANRYFEEMRAMVMRMVPAAEERWVEMTQAYRDWTGNKTMEFFPFLHGMQELMKQNLEPYFHAAGQDVQGEVLRKVKDMHFAYVAYLNHTHHMQRMVMDAGATVLPDLLQEARKQYTESQEMPSMEDFFRQYVDRLEAAIVEVMHTEEYSTVQNEVMKAGTTSKRIFEEIMEIVLKDWPFLTKKEADDLVRETTLLKRRVRDLEARLKSVNGNGTPSPADAGTSQALPALQDDLLDRVGKAQGPAKDDLTAIKGIGGKLAGMLNDLGIRTFAQISRMDDYAYGLLDALIPAYKGRARKEDWAGQARKMNKEKTLA